MIQIFKFGGASVRDAASISNMAGILLQNRPEKLVVVISAMGKTTVELENLAVQWWEGKEDQTRITAILDYHDQIANELKIDSNSRYFSLREQFQQEITVGEKSLLSFTDKVIAFGELFSTAIIESYLSGEISTRWMDARDFIKTSNDFGEARVDWSMTENAVNKAFRNWADEVIVTQGFIGSYLNYRTTTLGKEGSDYTAAILGACLKATAVTVWKDVPGILNADPRLMEDTVLFPSLSYQEITEMTYYGAKVIHPKTMIPLSRHKIPLYVKSFIDPAREGTHIEDLSKRGTQLPTYIFKFDQMVVTLRVREQGFMDELKLMRIFKVLHELNIKLNMMQNSALTLTLCIHESMEKFEKIREKLSGEFVITYNVGLHLATIMNYTDEAISQIPGSRGIILEQKSRAVYQVLYEPIK